MSKNLVKIHENGKIFGNLLSTDFVTTDFGRPILPPTTGTCWVLATKRYDCPELNHHIFLGN